MASISAIDGGGSESSSSAEDDNGNGTHLAATIGALDNAIGIVVAAINKMLETIASQQLNPRDVVANLSFGTRGQNLIIQASVSKATALEICFSTATGNDSNDIDGCNGSSPFIPASYGNAQTGIYVTSAINSNLQMAGFSSYNLVCNIDDIGFAAPSEKFSPGTGGPAPPGWTTFSTLIVRVQDDPAQLVVLSPSATSPSLRGRGWQDTTLLQASHLAVAAGGADPLVAFSSQVHGVGVGESLAVDALQVELSGVDSLLTGRSEHHRHLEAGGFGIFLLKGVFTPVAALLDGVIYQHAVLAVNRKLGSNDKHPCPRQGHNREAHAREADDQVGLGVKDGHHAGCRSIRGTIVSLGLAPIQPLLSGFCL